MEIKLWQVCATFLLFIQIDVRCAVFNGVFKVPTDEEQCFQEYCGVEFDPYTPLIKCADLPEEFYDCNETVSNSTEYSCQFGGMESMDGLQADTMLVNCTAFPGIECHGERIFLKEQPCLKFNGHHFVTILIFSVFLGFIGLDRFCLGHIPTAVGKLVTVGGLGIWWIIDVVLLVTGYLKPKDGSSWCP